MSEHTAEEKNIIIGIRHSLEKATKFFYYNGIEYKASNDVKETRPESIEFKVAQGTYFDIGDYFILKEVHNLGVTNVSTMLKRLAVESRRNPQKAYPVYDYHSLMSRMRFLVRHGLLFSFEYLDVYKRSMFVFCCTMYGWRLYKNKLQSPDLYDKNVVFKAETEVFKRLASNAVAYAFASSPSCTSIIVNDMISIDGIKRDYLYAKVTLEQEQKHVYIIEPVYFSVDARVVSDEENEEKIIERLTRLEEIINHFNTETPTKLIICVENASGLSRLINKIIMTRDMDFYLNNCYFTSENVLFENKDTLSRSFLKLKDMSLKEKGEIKFGISLAVDEWF